MTREEAIEVYNGLINTKIKEAFEFFAPELAESEDERIRKGLIEALKASKTVGELKFIFPEPTREECIAYLEKQKGQKIVYEDEYQRMLSDSYNCGKDEVISNPEKYGLQKEQIPYTDFVIKPHKGDDTNPYDMSASEAEEYTIKRGFGVPLIDGEVYVDERHIIQTVGNILRWADEHPKEKNPATAYTLQSSWETTNHQKPEWSEEDERKLQKCIKIVERWEEDYDIAYSPYSNLLKSLRPGWKPTEEQMNALQCAIVFMGIHKAPDYDITPLKSLYEQLKKLM